MQKNDEIIIDITDMSSEGSGVGKYDSMAVFVPCAAVGDRLKIRIVKKKKTYAFGKILEIVSPSVSRIKSDCDVFNQCGGCVYRHINYKSECEIKYNKVYEAMKRIGGIDIKPKPIIAAVKPDNYRNKAQYPVDINGNVGFYAAHSHRIVSCCSCKLQPIEFDKITAITGEWIRKYKISIYNEEKNTGLLRHIYLRKAEKTGEIMFTAVINGNKMPYSDELIESLKELLGVGLKSVQLNINKSDTNVILGDKCVLLYGSEYITDILCGLKIRLSPLSFYQVNRDMAEILYKKVAEYVNPDGLDILDLYCGAGTIGLSMAEKANSIIGVEIVAKAVEDAKINAASNGISNAKFICGDAKTAAEELAKEKIQPHAVIVDPPRKGCTIELLETIANNFNPEKIVYVSCDPATLARDAAILKDLGYIIKEYTPVDMFPRTSHVETVCLLSKLRSRHHIEIEMSMDEIDLTAAESKATYEEIKDYVLEHTGLKVSNLYIAQVKQKCGIIERVNYNLPKSENSRQPKCTPEKEKAIRDALEHFYMI